MSERGEGVVSAGLAEREEFALRYLVMTLRGPDFREDVIPRHYEFLAELRASGKLERAGPFTDRSGGAYVLRADNLDDARRIAFEDPLHRENCSATTVREWDVR